jgi:hypothetical protein
MRHAVIVGLLLAAGAGAAFAQDDRDRKAEDLKREFERSMKGLEEKFQMERSRLEKEFRAARERLLEKRGEPDQGKEPRGAEELLREVLKRVESIEKRLDGELPRLREFRHLLPPEFDFKRLPAQVPEEFRKWLEQMPRFRKDEDFKFEFRKQDKKGEDKKDEKPDQKKPKKEDEDL